MMFLNKLFDMITIVWDKKPKVNIGGLMKTEKNILFAFVLNLCFAVFELIGGAITGSVAIISDAVHDLADAVSIGLSFCLERKSKRKPDDLYTYGYVRYSVIGSAVTTLILVLGSLTVFYRGVERIVHPVAINYNGMILFAIVGVAVNLCAAWCTREGDSLNQKAVNLHMLEDVLGWVAVLLGAVVMRFADIPVLDPILSICVALWVFIGAVKNMKAVCDVFLEKTPKDIALAEVKTHICRIAGVQDVHHIHIWSLDGRNHCATMHIVTDRYSPELKESIREELTEHGISHATLEFETAAEHCHDTCCQLVFAQACGHHHHHHHH